MTIQNDATSGKFSDLVGQITEIGIDWHTDSLLKNATANKKFIDKSIKDLPEVTPLKAKSAIVVSAGPSLHKYQIIKQIKEYNYSGTIISIDGSYVKCLKEGLIPDYVLTLDPHPTRIVRWFGDPDFEGNSKLDDYFSRQDLDVEFRNNGIKENENNIKLINEYAPSTKLVICTTAPANVAKRVINSGHDLYWWNPLVDDPNGEGSITRKLFEINGLPCFNTGGTVGTAAWVFGNSILNIPEIAVVGMDLGYHSDLPIEMTQTYYELQQHVDSADQISDLFPEFTYPLTGETFYTDPTYYWYKKNFLELLEKTTGTTYNCTGGGTLFGNNIECISLEGFLTQNYG